jgi:hypothetical protein
LPGKKTNLFALLGWEAGLFIRNILQHCKAGTTAADEILPLLCKQDIESPRGWLKTDPDTFHVYGASWLVSCSENGEITIIKEASGVEEEWKLFTSETWPAGESSGWRNTYLCI